jgi:hypothetical protein
MGRYDKYICTTLHKRHMLPGPTPEQRDELAADGLRISMEHVLWIDSDVIPGAYYGESTWIWPKAFPGQISDEELTRRTTSGKLMFPHDHGFPEILSWWGGDPDHPEDTTAMTMIMGDEEIPLNTSWIAYVPAGMIHMPKMTPGGKVTDKPICHWTFGPGAYTRDKDGEEVKDEHGEALKGHATVPGKTDNRRYFVLGGQQREVRRPDYMADLDLERVRPVAFIDETVIPDAELGCYVMHVLPTSGPTDLCIMKAHTLPHGSFFTLTAINYDDITDLAAEAEFWIGGEKHTITDTFGAYIPPGVENGPLVIRGISKQLFFMIAYPTGKGITKYPGY